MWYGCTMDDGVIVVGETRTHVVEQLLNRTGGSVLKRFQYGIGDYGYQIGFNTDDYRVYYVIRSDQMRTAGFETRPKEGRTA